MRILLLDNYDSFTYNLFQYLCELGASVVVRRNDEIDVQEAQELDVQAIVVSPGPCTPAEAGISVQLIREMGDQLPILGVCLGHQAIGAAFGGHIVRAPAPIHGKTSPIYHRGEGVFAEIPSPFRATRYHSLVVERDSLPEELDIIAETGDGLIMGLRHRHLLIEGVQFHPESLVTEYGHQILRNFLCRI